MKGLVAFLKKLPLRQLLTGVLAVGILFFNTACNAGNVQGARPHNPPVQAGGQNNPHKAGGDGYTNYKMSTDVKKGRADLQILSNRLIAQTTYDTYPVNSDRLIYSGSEPQKAPLYNPSGLPLHQAGTSVQESDAQPSFDRSDPDAGLMERIGSAFKDASGFLSNDPEENPGINSNPAGRGHVDGKSQ